MIVLLWAVTFCWFVGTYQRFGETYFFHLQGCEINLILSNISLLVLWYSSSSNSSSSSSNDDDSNNNAINRYIENIILT
jgi:hypothetical protein